MIQPRNGYVLAVKEEKKTTEGGLIIPNTVKDDMPEIAIVTNAGDVEDIKKDDKIIFKRYASTIVKLDGTEYLLVEDEDIIGIDK